MDDSSAFTDVWMIQRDLSLAPDFPLPPGYTIRFYREGDAETWVRIQRACADDLSFITAEHFHADMPGDADHLAERVLFLTDPLGNDIGTIVAWNDSKFDGRDIGRIHWVAIVAEAQGRGLSKPMMSTACKVLRKFNYTEACLETHTSLIPALNLYLEFGFRPFPRSEGERAAWRAVAPRVKFAINL
jgi:GNAT superfamily N-acetyltransferase